MNLKKCLVKTRHCLLALLTLLSMSGGQTYSKVKEGQSHTKNPQVFSLKTKEDILRQFQKVTRNPRELEKIRQDVINMGPQATAALIQVMKGKTYPDKMRWMATFLLGRIMGQKASPLVAKFTDHPHWVLRLAGLKTLLALQEKRYGSLYVKRLKDPSLLVRTQALKNIQSLGLRQYGKEVWSMLYDERNYSVRGKVKKRTELMKTVIQVLGDLKFQKALRPLIGMLQKQRYRDLFRSIDNALGKMTQKPSPKGTLAKKRQYWRNFLGNPKTLVLRSR